MRGVWATKGISLRKNVLRNLFPWPLDKRAFLEPARQLARRRRPLPDDPPGDPGAARRCPARAALPGGFRAERGRPGRPCLAIVRRKRPLEPRDLWGSSVRCAANGRTRSARSEPVGPASRCARLCRVRGWRAASPSCWTPTARPPTMSPATNELCIDAAASRHSTSSSVRLASLPVTISSAWKPGSQSTSTEWAGSSRALCSRSAYARESSSDTPTKTEKVSPDSFSAFATARLISSSSPIVNASPAGTCTANGIRVRRPRPGQDPRLRALAASVRRPRAGRRPQRSGSAWPSLRCRSWRWRTRSRRPGPESRSADPAIAGQSDREPRASRRGCREALPCSGVRSRPYGIAPRAAPWERSEEEDRCP